MPQVARVGDADTNHAPCPAGSCQTGSPNVLANNIAVHRVGDSNTPHGLYTMCSSLNKLNIRISKCLCKQPTNW